MNSKELDTTPDPGTGLSELDRHAIRTSWDLVADSASVKQNGIEFFMQLFDAYPYMLDMFPDFKDLSKDEMRKSPKLRAHALSVMYTIGNYVQHLDDAETLVALVEKIAVAHVNRNLVGKDFENLAKVFVSYLKDQFGDHVTSEVSDAWSKLLAAQVAIVGQVVNNKE